MDSEGNVDKDASRRVEIKFRLKDDEMIDELNKIMTSDEQESKKETSDTKENKKSSETKSTEKAKTE